jgi:hypothetical protein
MPSRRSVIIGLGLGLCLFGVVLAAYLSNYAALVELRRVLVGARVPSWLPAGATAGCDFQVGQCYSIASGLVSVSAFINTTRASFESCRDATGAITYAGNNQPCVTSECFGSTWPASTNLALQSQGGFNNTAYYTKSNVTITDNDGVAPDGTMTASTIIDDDTNATHHIRGQSNILVLSGATYTCSVFALGRYGQVRTVDICGYRRKLYGCRLYQRRPSRRSDCQQRRHTS